MSLEALNWIIGILYIAIAAGVMRYSHKQYKAAWAPKKEKEDEEDFNSGPIIAAVPTGLFWPISLIAHLVYLFLKLLTKKRSS